MMSMQYRPGDIYASPGKDNTQGYSTGYNNYNTMAGSGGGFAFRKRLERLDWKKIAGVDIDHISRNLDFNTLQENIMNITFCNIESELDIGTMDPHFVKLFKLAQLTIEYLLHSQDYLSGIVTAMEEKLQKALEEHEETQKLFEKQKSELNEVRKESHKRKKMLIAQQQIMNAGVNSYHKCAHCPKAFVNHTFLQSHLQRRHSEHMSQYNSASPLQSVPPPQPQPQQQFAQSQGQLSEEQKQLLEKELNEIKERLRLTESQLVEERNTRNSSNAKDRQEASRREKQTQQEMEAWKEQQMEKQQEEIEKVRNMFMKELKEMNEKYNAAAKALDTMQRKGRSNLGAMEDEAAEEKRLLRQQREEVAEIKEQLQGQLADVESSMEVKLKDQEDRWKEKMKEMNEKHKKELKQLNQAFEKTLEEIHDERQGHEDTVEDYKNKVEELQKAAKRDKENEKKMKDQDKQIDELSKKVHTPVAPLRPPDDEQDAVTSLPPARPMSPQMMEDDDDEMSEEDEEEEESSEFGDSTMATTGMFNGTGTLSLGTGTLKSMSVRLLDQMKKDPNLLKAMKEELTGVLDDNLERRGVPPTSRGISNSVLNDKLMVLKNERQQMAKRYSNLYDIRQQYIKQIDDVARDQLKKKKQEEAASAKLVAGPSSKQPPRPASPTRPVSPTRPPTNRSAPLPAPRALSPQGKLANTMSTMSSTGTYGTTTGSSNTWGTSTATSDSQWDSDEDSQQDEPDSARPDRRTPSPKKVTLNMEPQEEESDWDDGSELQEITPRGPPRTVSQSPKPRGANVARLTETIESQLGSRGKKPAGGIETVKMEDSKAGKKRDDSWDDDDDDDFSVSSLEETASAPPSRNASFNRKQNTPSDVSTGTSVWGSSKDKNRPQPSPRRTANPASTTNRGGTIGSVGKNSFVSVSDFDDDSDLDMEDL